VTLSRFFALTVALLALLAAGVLTLAVRAAGKAVVATGESSRNTTAARVVADLEAELGVAEAAVADFERGLTVGVLSNADLRADPRADPQALRRYLTGEMIARRGLTELTLTMATFERYDDQGNLVVAAHGRRQLSVFRDSADGLVVHTVADVIPGMQGDPTQHDTFKTAAHLDSRGKALWSDLAWSERDAALPPNQRRKILTVQKAIVDTAGVFVGVLRAGIVSEALDRVGAAPAGDPHRLFICDTFGRLVTRMAPGDGYAVIDQEGQPDPEGDLRVVATGTSPEVSAALQLARGGASGGQRVMVGREAYFVTLAPLAEGRAQRWLVGIVVPERFYVGSLTAARDRLLILLVVIVVAIAAIGLGGARTVGRGVGALVASTEAMRRFQFAPSAATSAFREVRGALESVERAKTALRAMVKYVPIGLVRRLYESGREPVLGAEVMDVSLMFTDIADFTTHAEAMAPAQLAESLGRYLEVATRAVEEQGGTVDKYIGDALMVLWNAPTPIEAHPAAACRAALACAAATQALNASAWWQSASLPAWRTRFGLHCDRVLVGHFGAPERLSYTAMGDGVNLAARLEGLNKLYGTTILVSGELRARAGDAFVYRLIDRVAVKGKSRAVELFELLGRADDQRVPAWRTTTAIYEAALTAATRQRDFNGALALLAGLPHDPPASVLAGRCRAWLASPPPPDWDGTWMATSK